MFNDEKITQLQAELLIKETTIKDLREDIKTERQQKDQIAKDFASKERILRNELGIEVGKAVDVEKEKTLQIKEENAVLRTKVEILEKAFENMGFDVKDMKEILNKLVDGLIAKNEIKLVK